jgi:hypothetical protein
VAPGYARRHKRAQPLGIASIKGLVVYLFDLVALLPSCLLDALCMDTDGDYSNNQLLLGILEGS